MASSFGQGFDSPQFHHGRVTARPSCFTQSKQWTMKYLLLWCLLFPLWGAGQQTLNVTDESGRRQGYWEKKYPNGKLMYQGTFKDGKPVGQWKRYHDSGNLKAVMEHSETSDTVRAKLYETSSRPVAEGAYLGEKKCGTWTYFSNDVRIAEEVFIDGRKSGISRKYYLSGELLEESYWKEELREGKYTAFFPSGKPFLQCYYKEGKRNGPCISYFPSGAVEVESEYLDDLPGGSWKYYDPSGAIRYTLLYEKGILKNPDVLLKMDSKQLEELELQRDKLVDPEKYLLNPEEFLERKR